MHFRNTVLLLACVAAAGCQPAFHTVDGATDASLLRWDAPSDGGASRPHDAPVEPTDAGGAPTDAAADARPDAPLDARPDAGGSGCSGRFRDCNGVADDGCETNVGSDPYNCGSCGRVCPAPPLACAAGVCASE